MNQRRRWGWMVLGIILLGIGSRLVRTGWVVLDKYLGDALYAGMVYGLVRMFRGAGAAAGWAVVVMTGIELFQLTGLPAEWFGSEVLAVRLGARLLGVQFSGWDLLAYGVGIGLLYWWDVRR
jgi:hypothetical protein